jgi:membrane-associated phospholipid phosphatase
VLRLALAVTCLLVSTADAEPWYRGKYGRNRVLHLSVTLGGGALYVASLPLEKAWAPDPCKWCEPTTLDRRVREALVWDDVVTARGLSHTAAFALSPIVTGGLVLLYTPPEAAELIDNVVPIAEAMMATLWVTRAVKILAGRQRPYAHFGVPEDEEDNVSFPSGHTSRAFSVAAAAAVVAHERGYASEPYVIGAGAAIGVAAGYLRIAADRHYITDVVAGAALGTAVGFAVPFLMKRDVDVVPTRNGVALAGAW